MSDSYNTEQYLREIAENLRSKASDLESAADALALLRQGTDLAEAIALAKARVRQFVR